MACSVERGSIVPSAIPTMFQISGPRNQETTLWTLIRRLAGPSSSFFPVVNSINRNRGPTVMEGLRRKLAWTAIAVFGGSAALAAPPPALDGSSNMAISRPATETSRWVGMSTCMTASCHGGPVTEPTESAWRHSYTTWFNRDPHAAAYEVLWNDRSC